MANAPLRFLSDNVGLAFLLWSGVGSRAPLKDARAILAQLAPRGAGAQHMPETKAEWPTWAGSAPEVSSNAKPAERATHMVQNIEAS